MENRNYSGLQGENMTSPSIFNTAQKTPPPVQPQPMPITYPTQVSPQQTVTQPTPMPAPMPAPMPMPKQMPMPQTQPIYIPQPAPMPKQMPQPKPMPMPQPIIVQQPQPQPMPQPIIIQQPQPQPQPMPQPTQVQQMEINIQLVYPEVYYRIRPHVKKACDRMCLNSAPSQDLLDSLTESVHDEVCRAHPDISDYVYGQMTQEEPVRRKKGCCNPCNICGYGSRRSTYGDRRPMPYQEPRPAYPTYPYPTGNRGILGDLITIMLLNEFNQR